MLEQDSRDVLAVRRDFIVIGASAGGVHALRTIVAALPDDLQAAVFIVLHVGAHASTLPDILRVHGKLAVDHARDGEVVSPGRIYVAPPDRNMMIEGDTVRVLRSPKEHHTRPAIDPLFRSAALSHGPRVIGVVLSGRLDDGTAGLHAIKQCGGLALVQDPREAEEPSMPLSAMRHVEVDHCMPLRSIAPQLSTLAAQRVQLPVAPPPIALAHEDALARDRGNLMGNLNAIGDPTTLTCPDCHGTLWQVANAKPARYRCHTGHAFSMRSLPHAQSDATDEALWSGVRALQEMQMLCKAAAVEASRNGEEAGVAARYDRQAEEIAEKIVVLRRLIEQL